VRSLNVTSLNVRSLNVRSPNEREPMPGYGSLSVRRSPEVVLWPGAAASPGAPRGIILATS
jgi:hypothetical protein